METTTEGRQAMGSTYRSNQYPEVNRLAEHFALSDDSDLASEWQPFPADAAIEGAITPDGRNVWRRLPWHPEYGWQIEVDLRAQPDPETGRIRVRMPVVMDPLPWNGDRIYGCMGWSRTVQWYERVGDEMHMVIEVVR